jgi:hypothetical protein
LWLFGTSISGPLIGITSSMNIAMFIARGSHGRGQRLGRGAREQPFGYARRAADLNRHLARLG